MREDSKPAPLPLAGQFNQREGEVLLEQDPALMVPDAGLVFIGHVRSPWTQRRDCPKNMRQARERGLNATVHVDEAYRAGLLRLRECRHIFLLTWLHLGPRNLAVQLPHGSEQPSGTFSLRSPLRPNPIGLHMAELVEIDEASGILTINGIDVLDKTPLLDIKPFFATTDIPTGLS